MNHKYNGGQIRYGHQVQKFNQQHQQVFKYGDESKDINDPGWEHLKRLKTDDECYRAVRGRWKNTVIPDPTLNLTLQNYRTKHGKNGVEERKILIPKRSQPAVPCNQLFYQKVRELDESAKKRKEEFNRQYHARIQEVAKKQKMEEERLRRTYGNYGYDSASSLMGEVRDKYQLQKDAITKDRLEFEQREINDERIRQSKRAKFEEAARETETYHKFYYEISKQEAFNQGTPFAVYEIEQEECNLRQKQVDDWNDTERMFKYYEKFYGKEEDSL